MAGKYKLNSSTVNYLSCKPTKEKEKEKEGTRALNPEPAPITS